MRRLSRSLAGATLLTLGVLALAPTPARAQPPAEEAAPAEGETEGNMYYGYIGTGVLAAGIVFIVCKTARR